DDVDALPVGGGGGGGVPPAQVPGPRPGPVGNLPVPEPLAVAGPVADDVVLGERLLAETGRPVARGDEDLASVADGTGLVLVQAGLTACPGQGGLPQDVLALLAAPGQGQPLLGADALARRAAPARPVAGQGQPRQGQAREDHQPRGATLHGSLSG